MQPLLKAVGRNSIPIRCRLNFGDHATDEPIVVTVDAIGEKKVRAAARRFEDNGLGLDAHELDAFTTTDTDNKLSIGGRGVGRLLWLDCFEHVHVDTVFCWKKGLVRRAFDFVLANDEQIVNYQEELAQKATTQIFGPL